MTDLGNHEGDMPVIIHGGQFLSHAGGCWVIGPRSTGAVLVPMPAAWPRGNHLQVGSLSQACQTNDQRAACLSTGWRTLFSPLRCDDRLPF